MGECRDVYVYTQYMAGRTRGFAVKFLNFGQHDFVHVVTSREMTRTRIEATAALAAVEMCVRLFNLESCTVRVRTNSKYVDKAVRTWLPKWRERGWTTTRGGAVENADVWRAMDGFVAAKEVHVHSIVDFCESETMQKCRDMLIAAGSS